MKQITDLKIQRAKHISDMQAIVNSAKEGQRDLSTEESARWSQIDGDIKKIDSQIAILERQDELNKTIVTESRDITPVQYNIARGLFNHFHKKTDGVEFDLHSQLARSGGASDGRTFNIPMSAFSKRAALLKSTDSAWEPTSVESLSILSSKNFLQELGVVFLRNQVGNVVLPSMDQLSASFVNENVNMSEFTITQVADTLSARRVAGYKDVSLEFMSSNNIDMLNAIVVDGVNSLYRAITADICDNIDSHVTPMTGKASGDTAEFLSLGLLTDMEASLDTTALENLKYFTTLGVKGYAKKTTGFTYGNAPIWMSGEMNDYPSYASNLVNKYSGDTKHQLILGDFSKIVIAEFGSVQVLLDPFTNGLKSFVRIIISLPVDTGVWNKSAFSLVQNIKTA